MKGQQTVAAELSPEISPTIQLESSADIEWDFLKSVKRLGCSERIAANVAGGGQMRFRNPAGSGVLAVFDELRVHSNGAVRMTIQVIETGADLLNSALTVAMDTRWEQAAFAQQSAVLATFQNTTTIGVGTGTIYTNVFHLERTDNIFNRQIVLAPGFAVGIGSVTSNQLFAGTAYWHERQLPALET